MLSRVSTIIYIGVCCYSVSIGCADNDQNMIEFFGDTITTLFASTQASVAARILQQYGITSLTVPDVHNPKQSSSYDLAQYERQEQERAQDELNDFMAHISISIDEHSLRLLCEDPENQEHPISLILEWMLAIDSEDPVIDHIYKDPQYLKSFTKEYLRSATPLAQKLLSTAKQHHPQLFSAKTCLPGYIVTANFAMLDFSLSSLQNWQIGTYTYQMIQTLTQLTDPAVWSTEIREVSLLQRLVNEFNSFHANFNQSFSYILQAILEEVPAVDITHDHLHALLDIHPYVEQFTQNKDTYDIAYHISHHIDSIYTMLRIVLSRNPGIIAPPRGDVSLSLYTFAQGVAEIESYFGKEQAMQHFGDSLFRVLDLLYQYDAAAYMPKAVLSESYIIRRYYQREKRLMERISQRLEEAYNAIAHLAHSLV